MKKFILKVAVFSLIMGFGISCKDSRTEKLEDRLEEKSEKLEDRSDDYEDASDHIGSAAENIEEAMEDFSEALEEVENPEDRKIIRQRINAILDSLEIRKQD